MTDEFLRTHPNFKANLFSLYMTPTTYKFRFPEDRNFDHYVAYASKTLKNSPSGKISVFISSNSNSIFSNLHNMILTLRPMISPLPLALKSFIIKPINVSLEQKHPQNFILQNHKFTSPFSYHSQYSVNHLFTID